MFIGAAEAVLGHLRSGAARLRAGITWLASLPAAYPGPVGFGLMFLLLVASAHLSVSFFDEGYEWYAAQRVLSGEIPIRDFDSYDPGRYYWSAAVMSLLHSRGLVALRIAVALFAGIGLWTANSLVCRERPRMEWWFCLMAAVTFVAWMFPEHKLFDITASIVLVAMLTWLIEQPTRYRCFIGGLGVGVVAIFGRNHGLYGAVAGLMALAYLGWATRTADLVPSLFYWCMGVVVGYSPMLLAIAFVPGFWTWLWASIRVYFEVGSTNEAVPIPWPWRVPLTEAPADLARDWLVGILLMLLPIFGVTVAAYSAWRARVKKLAVNPLLLAAALLAIPYTHHAYARAGLGHLTQAIFPLLIGVLAWVASLPRRSAIVLVTGICAASVFLMLPHQLLYQRWHEGDWVDIKVGDDILSVNPYVGKRIEVMSALVEKYAPGGRTFLAAPYLPGAYAIFDRRAPLWDSYPLFTADEWLQQATIERIKTAHPSFAILEEEAMDNDPELSYRRTNPMVYAYIQKSFVRVNEASVPEFWGWDIYVPVDDGKSEGAGMQPAGITDEKK